MRSSIRLGRIAGIEIGIHYTWIFIFLLVSWSLAQGFFPEYYPGWERMSYWITGVASALLLFVSVLLHELAHSLVAQARGMRVQSITLFIFGGVSNIEEEAEQPRIEFAMAIVGPLTSLALAGVFWAVLETLGDRQAPLAATLGYLALINAILGVFNLLPGFPLDGGRVLRSILWGQTGSLSRATNIAATVGRLFGWGLIAFGVFQLLSGNFLGGLWIAFIGWFLSSAADASRQEMTMKGYLSGVKVRDVMDPNPETIEPGMPVVQMVEDVFRRHRRRAVPVKQNGELRGIVTVTDVKDLPRERWGETEVRDIMTREPLYTVGPDDYLSSAMKLIAQHDINQVLVLEKGELVGFLSRAEILRHIQFTQELGTAR